MSFSVSVYNPAFPKDKTKARKLSKAQFDVVKNYIVACMNASKKIREPIVLQMLVVAQLPVDFESQE